MGLIFWQAGLVETLDSLVKEFVAASNEEKKSIFTKIEEEVGKLKGSTARYYKSLHLTRDQLYHMIKLRIVS